MASTADLGSNPYPKILIVGDGGTQKTRFLAGCPSPFVFDFDNGMTSTRDLPPVEYETFKDAPWVSAPKYGNDRMFGVDKARGIYPWGMSWPRFIDFLNEKIWPHIEAGDWPYLTLGMDSLTTLANQSMNYTLKGDGKTGAAKVEIQHWGTQLRLLETVVEQLASWPIRLIMTAHIKRDENIVSGESKEYLPLVAGQLSGKLPIYFDEVYYMKMVQGEPTFVTQNSLMYRQAKSRHNVPTGTAAKWSAIAPFFEGTQAVAAKTGKPSIA